MINRLIEPTSREDLARRRGRDRDRPGAAAPADGLRHPAGRPVPASHRRPTTWRRSPACSAGTAGASASGSPSCSQLVGLDPGVYAAAVAARAVRRPAPAGRRGPRPRRRSAGAARWTSRSAPSTRSPAIGCRASSSTSSSGSARPWCSSPTTSRRRCASATGSRCCPRAASSSSTPRRARSSGAPASPFVADFVGDDRSLRRLAVVALKPVDVEPLGTRRGGGADPRRSPGRGRRVAARRAGGDPRRTTWRRRRRRTVPATTRRAAPQLGPRGRPPLARARRLTPPGRSARGPAS